MTIKSPKKLIEVALPLDDINAAAAREKSIRHGHPSTLHLWWARRPLAAARAVLFAQMVNDPGGERGYKAGLTKEQANARREKLFEIIRELVKRYRKFERPISRFQPVAAPGLGLTPVAARSGPEFAPFCTGVAKRAAPVALFLPALASPARATSRRTG